MLREVLHGLDLYRLDLHRLDLAHKTSPLNPHHTRTGPSLEPHHPRLDPTTISIPPTLFTFKPPPEPLTPCRVLCTVLVTFPWAEPPSLIEFPSIFNR